MVNKTFLLMRSFLKKSIVQIVNIILLITLSSILLNTVLIIGTDYTKNFDRMMEELNSEDIEIIYYNVLHYDQYDQVKDAIESLDGVGEYEIDRVVAGTGYTKFGNGEISNILTFISLDECLNKKVGKFDILESVDRDGVILNYIFKVSGGYDIGSTIDIRFDDVVYTYEVIGFYNNATTGTINCSNITFILTNDLYNEIYSANNPSIGVHAKVKDGYDIKGVFTDLSKSIKKKTPLLLEISSNDVYTIKDIRYSNADLFKIILTLGTIIMIAVLLIIIFISLSNYIKNTTKELGTLKAIGYTSNGIIIPIVLALTIISIIASTVGGLLSYLVLPAINSALETQIGIPYHIHFIVIAFIITLISLTIIVFCISYISLFKIRGIAPINAIRSTSDAKRKTNNIIKLEKSRFNVNTAIGLKGFFSSIRRNVVIIFALTSVSFLAGFSAFLYQNVIKDIDGLIELCVGQVASSNVTVDYQTEKSLLKQLENDENIESYYLYTVESLTPVNTPKLYTFVVNNSDDLNKDVILIDGRLPLDDEEIAINGSYAKKYKLKIGDQISFISSADPVTFTICGLTQGAYYNGRDSYLLRKGYEKIESIYLVSYYVNVKDGVDIDLFNLDLASRVHLTCYVNQISYFGSQADLYAQILVILAIAICLLSILIIVFVLYILIYILLRNKRREHGILKSIGYTSFEIRKQTLLNIVPSCAFAIILGLLISRGGVKEILSLALVGVGILKFGTSIKFIYLLIVGLFLILFTLIYTILLSRSVKKITPHELFNNE